MTETHNTSEAAPPTLEEQNDADSTMPHHKRYRVFRTEVNKLVRFLEDLETKGVFLCVEDDRLLSQEDYRRDTTALKERALNHFDITGEGLEAERQQMITDLHKQQGPDV